MHHRDDLACILSGGPIIRRQHKELIWAGCKILAGPILAAPFAHNEQPARFAGIFSLGVG
jgi:hypothetical protein